MFHKKLVILFFLFLVTEFAYSQCAMCKAVVESGDNTMAEGVNDGISYLMVFPYLLIGVLLFSLYKYKKSFKN